MYHLGTLQLICIKLEALIKGSDEKCIFFLKQALSRQDKIGNEVTFFPPVVVDDSHLKSKMVLRLYQYNQQKQLVCKVFW